MLVAFYRNHTTMYEGAQCRKTVDKLTWSKGVGSGSPHLPVLPHLRKWQPRLVLVTSSSLSEQELRPKTLPNLQAPSRSPSPAQTLPSDAVLDALKIRSPQ